MDENQLPWVKAFREKHRKNHMQLRFEYHSDQIESISMKAPTGEKFMSEATGSKILGVYINDELALNPELLKDHIFFWEQIAMYRKKESIVLNFFTEDEKFIESFGSYIKPLDVAQSSYKDAYYFLLPFRKVFIELEKKYALLEFNMLTTLENSTTGFFVNLVYANEDNEVHIKKGRNGFLVVDSKRKSQSYQTGQEKEAFELIIQKVAQQQKLKMLFLPPQRYFNDFCFQKLSIFDDRVINQMYEALSTHYTAIEIEETMKKWKRKPFREFATKEIDGKSVTLYRVLDIYVVENLHTNVFNKQHFVYTHKKEAVDRFKEELLKLDDTYEKIENL